jgi:CheY-like chemotaxis protein
MREHDRSGPVLVVEDDPDTRELLATVIAKAGYAVITARDGREALAMLPLRPALIFVDLSMPVMTGEEFREAQRRNREWIAIPTIVMTGTSDEPLLDLAIEQTLRKPVPARRLLDIVRAHLGEPARKAPPRHSLELVDAP